MEAPRCVLRRYHCRKTPSPPPWPPLLLAAVVVLAAVMALATVAVGSPRRLVAQCSALARRFVQRRLPSRSRDRRLLRRQLGEQDTRRTERHGWRDRSVRVCASVRAAEPLLARWTRAEGIAHGRCAGGRDAALALGFERTFGNFALRGCVRCSDPPRRSPNTQAARPGGAAKAGGRDNASTALPKRSRGRGKTERGGEEARTASPPIFVPHTKSARSCPRCQCQLAAPGEIGSTAQRLSPS
eukprot:365195-Chlamydomonas_euryale.AAC.4